MTACANAALVSVPQTITGNRLNTHDGFYSLVAGTLANGAPVFKWRKRDRSRTPSEDIFLFRASNGAWVIGPNASLSTGKMQSNLFTALCPGDAVGNASWAYYDGSNSTWHCTSWDRSCVAGSGITVEPRCVTVDAYATAGSDRFAFSPCGGSSPPPPPPTIQVGRTGGPSASADAAGGSGLTFGLIIGAAALAVVLACWFGRWWWQRLEDREYGRQMRHRSSCGCRPATASGKARSTASRARVAATGAPPQLSPPRPPPPVSVHRDRTSSAAAQYSPTRLAALAQSHLDRHARRQAAYTGVERAVELQPIARQPPMRELGRSGRPRPRERSDQFV